MDGRGRLAQPLKRRGTLPAKPARAEAGGARRRVETRVVADRSPRIPRFMRNSAVRMADLRPPRFAGAAASALLILASIGYGAVKGGHVPMIVGVLKDTRDAAAN